MIQKKPEVSIIIANKDGERFLKRCLDSILSEKGNYEVIVVDDGSTDKSVELISKLYGKDRHVKIIALPDNVGAAGARNMGVREAKGDYLFFLDSDTKVEPGWRQKIIKFFEKNKRAGAAQVKLLTMNTNKYDYAGDFMGPFGFLIERARGAQDSGQFDEDTPIFSGKSAGMIVRKRVFEEIGGFDTDYWIFLEDTDLCWRIWLTGQRVLFAPEITVWHAYWTDEKPFQFYVSNKVFYRGCKNTITTLIKNLGMRKAIPIVPLNVLCWSIIAIMFLLRGKSDRSKALMMGIVWNIYHLPQTLQKRKIVQAQRKISDSELFALVGKKQSISYYLGKALAYTAGRSF